MVGVLFFASCCGHKPPPQVGYWGETKPMSEVVARVNQNNLAIPSLYARHTMQADLYDPGRKKSFYVNTSGNLLMRKPRDLLLRGRHDLAGEIFAIGSTEERFWFSVYEGDATQWWGHYRNIGKDCMAEMPVRPDLIGEVLGITNIPTNFLEAPFPTMRFNHEQDVYMIVWNARLADRFYAQREVWYDRSTFRPRAVFLYDYNGRLLVRAFLMAHEPVEMADRPRESWPVIATEYRFLFPGTKPEIKASTMTLKLSEPALVSSTGQPKPGAIRFTEDPKVNTVIQVDEACDK
jgi:hypothetical protein